MSSSIETHTLTLKLRGRWTTLEIELGTDEEISCILEQVIAENQEKNE